MGTPQLFDLDEEGNPIDPNAGQSTEEPTDIEATEEAGEPQTDEDVTGGDELPEKLKGKSAAEIARMYVEVEKRLGTQGDEVGQLRQETSELKQFFDNYVQSQTVAHQGEPEEEDLDFYTDPEAAVQRAIDKHPKVQQAESVSQTLAQGAAQVALQRKHPDYLEIVASQEFQQWKDGKAGLAEMFFRADQQYDVEAADTLLTLWKERQGAAQAAADIDKQARTQSARAASTGNVSSAAPGKTAKRTYRRSDIIKLMQSDPDQYQARQPEIMAAYAEGRVI